MRVKFSFFTVLFGLFSLLIVPFHACTTPSNNNNNNTNKDGGTSNDAGTIKEKKKFRVCVKGEKIKECSGSSSCDAQKDCGRLDGYDLKGMCRESMCAVVPKKQNATLKGDKAPDLSCLTTPPALPQGPKTAIWWGPIETFGLNGDTTDLKVSIYDQEAFLKDSKTSPITTFTANTPKKETGCSKTCEADQVCFKKQCIKVQDSKGYSIGYFEFKDLPTNKLLAVKVEGAGFTDTYQFNIWIPADKLKDGWFKERAFVISDTTKSLIPATAGIAEISPEHSAIAGEIQDCAGEQIQGATVSFSLRPQKLAYFNGDGDQPDPAQQETNKDGTYVALNVKPPADGKIKVLVSANINGKLTTLATYTTKIFPDAITILTMQPWDPSKAKK